MILKQPALQFSGKAWETVHPTLHCAVASTMATDTNTSKECFRRELGTFVSAFETHGQ